MFKKLVKSLYAVPALLVLSSTAFAQAGISTTSTKAITSGSSTVFSDIGTFATWSYNLSFWIGGLVTFGSIFGGLALMAWKAWSTDDEAAKVAQTWFPKVVLAGFAGVLIMTIPLIFKFVTNTLGVTGGLNGGFDASQFK
jgi:hypothetical protein